MNFVRSDEVHFWVTQEANKMTEKTFPNLKYLATQTISWALLGASFGVFFGAVASVFQGGPSFAQGILESAPWFSAFGAVTGFILSFEKK